MKNLELKTIEVEGKQIVVTDSRKVAELLGKEHYDLIKEIDGRKDEKGILFSATYVKAFNDMQEKLKSGQANSFKTTEEFLIYQLQEQLKVKKQLQEQDTKLNEVNEEVTRMKDCILSDIDNKNWRAECKKLLFKTACRMVSACDELDRDEYLSKLNEIAWKTLKERMHCNVNARLKHMKERMLANGATKTQVNKLNRVDVVAQDDKLKNAYIAIVKEISMKY